jgi:hypothetical protein
MLSREQVIKELEKRDTIGKGKIVFKVIDYSENKYAPEDIAYRVFYTSVNGERRKTTYWPNTVGFQWS